MEHNSLLFGCNQETGLVAIEVEEGRGEDRVALFFRRNGSIISEHDSFEPFIVADSDVLDGCPGVIRSKMLEGNGSLDSLVLFKKWKDCLKAKSWLARETGRTSSAPGAPYLFINDPVQQYLMMSGRTMFFGMEFEEISRMQVDIECLTSEGFEFCNAEREGDEIAAIAMSDQSGWVEVLSAEGLSEKEMLEGFVDTVRSRDPDVIEGHNIFNFDLPYIAERAKRHKVKLALGRNGSVPKRRPSRFSAGERTVGYERFDIFGRHVVDTLFLVHVYDISHRSLSGFGLKEVAIHFGVAAPDRTYIAGSRISEEFKTSPAKVLKYVRDDVIETRELSRLLSMSNFVQARMLPYSYQNVCVKGNATKIDALMGREYLRRGHALPLTGQGREFAGGYTDMFVQGIVKDVHHCDVRSLYPSLMLKHRIGPGKDELGIFLEMLDQLRDFRVRTKEQMQNSRSEKGRTYLDAMQTTFKVLINSFYGYLGFSQARFSDFDAAERVTGEGRALLKFMIDWLKDHGAIPVEIDTDGIYFVPPSSVPGKQRGSRKVPSGEENRTPAGYRKEFSEALPGGIEIEFDGEYRSMYSYKMKNYALLGYDGEMVIKGAALKSRGLEPFQRSFLSEVIRLKLEGREEGISDLADRYRKAIRDRALVIEELAKTERLQDAPSTYTAKIAQGKRARSAAYELALRSGRDYRAGDQISYYVTGEKKSVSVHANSKLVSEWDPAARDENVAYYLAKFESLSKKFAPDDGQGELGL
jgi:DNA polymerase I